MNECMKGRGSLRLVDEGQEVWVQVWREHCWLLWQWGWVPLADPIHVPWFLTTDQPTWQNSQYPLLWQQVPTGRWASSYGIIFPPSHRWHGVCLFLLLSATSPPACMSHYNLYECTPVLCWWGGCLIITLHGTNDVIVHIGRSGFTLTVSP